MAVRAFALFVKTLTDLRSGESKYAVLGWTSAPGSLLEVCGSDV